MLNFEDIEDNVKEEQTLSFILMPCMPMTDALLLQLTGHHRLNQNNEMLRHLIDMRNPYTRQMCCKWRF